MSAIRCEVEPVGARLLVRLHGELSLSSAPRVRATLLKCLVDQPDAVVVDLSGLVLAQPAAAAVFLAVAHQASLWPGTPLLFVAPDPAMADLLATGYRRLALHPSVEDALSAEPRQRMLSISDVMLPVTGGARRARDLTTEACTRWNLPHLVGPAGLVASELVANAIVHAGTMIDLRLTLGRRHLIVAVRDGSSEVPVLPPPHSTDPASPRGLLLVDSLVQRWGSLPAHDGKVVWAALSRRHLDG